MPRFFLSEIPSDRVSLTGESARHIARSLRMKAGEKIVLCDGKGVDCHGEISQITDNEVIVEIRERVENKTEPSVHIRLYQAMPKGDKFEQIVQKSVELGVFEIIPVLTARCISRPDAKSMRKKIERYNKIAYEAAKQSGRGRIPLVRELLPFDQALKDACGRKGETLLFYECGGQRIPALVDAGCSELSIFIGSEGGFEPSEVERAMEVGAQIASLGSRILRCETAPLCALSVLLFYTQNI